jgi:hypothetical protein
MVTRDMTDMEILGSLGENISPEGRLALYQECEKRLESLSDYDCSSFSLLVCIDKLVEKEKKNSKPSVVISTDNQPKRRLSKAEKKNKKSNSTKTVSTPLKVDIEEDEESKDGFEDGMVLVLTVSYEEDDISSDNEDGNENGSDDSQMRQIRFKMSTPDDVRYSYLSAISLLKL